MKHTQKIILALLAILVGVTNSYAFIDSYTVSRDQLPQAAREMLDEHFPKAKVSMIKVDRHLLKKTDYDVKLTNGAKIEFNNKGKWTSVDCGSKALPEGLAPKAIARYVEKNFDGLKIVSISKRKAGYDIGLSDCTQHRFNALHQYKGQVTGDADTDSDADSDSEE